MKSNWFGRTVNVWCLAAVALAGMAVGCVVGVHGPDRVEVVDAHGYHHQGYYDDHHDWHGGYYDENHNYHDDAHDWHN